MFTLIFFQTAVPISHTWAYAALLRCFWNFRQRSAALSRTVFQSLVFVMWGRFPAFPKSGGLLSGSPYLPRSLTSPTPPMPLNHLLPVIPLKDGGGSATRPTPLSALFVCAGTYFDCNPQNMPQVDISGFPPFAPIFDPLASFATRFPFDVH